MLDDITAKEIIVLVKLLGTVEERTMLVANDSDELTFIESLPETVSLLKKINETAERPDVRKLLDERN